MVMKKNDKNKFPHANKLFTDREEPRKVFWDTYQLFKENMKNSQENEIKVITYYGIGGIGKTSLLKQIKTELVDKINKPLQIYIDFEDNPDMLAILIKMRNLLQKNYQFNSPMFDLAYYSYMQKQGQQVNKEEVESFISSSPVLNSILDISSILPGVGTIIGIIKGVDSLSVAIRNKLDDRKRELNEIKNDDPDMLLKNMPYYLACDIESNMERQTEPLVIYIDTYEVLVNELASIGSPLDKDKWLRHDERGLVVNIPNAIWVIAGRDKLKWEQINPDWEGTLDQHLLGNLSDVDAETFLYEAGVSDRKLSESIYKLTKGVPLFLDICVDRYHSLISKGMTPTIEDIGSNTHELISNFVKYMDDNKKALVYMLSCLEDWTDNLLSDLVQKFLPSLPFVTLSNMKNYSFITTEDNETYKMHQSIRKIIYKDCDKNLSTKVNLYMKEFYFEKLTKTNISISEYGNTLKKFVLYALEYGFDDENDFIDFYKLSLIPLNTRLLKLYKFNESIAIWEQLIEYTKTEFGEGLAKPYCAMNYAIAQYFAGNYHISLENIVFAFENFKCKLVESHEDTLKAMQVLIIAYRKTGEYEISLALSQELYELRRSVGGDEDSATIDASINLAIAYRKTGNYKEAVKILKEVLVYKLDIFGEEHSSTINAMSSLANAYHQSGANLLASELSIKVVKFNTSLEGENHPATLAAIGSLAHSYRLLGRYDLAVELSEKVVEARSEALGEEHPLTVRAMNNLSNSYRKIGKYEEALVLAEKVYQSRLDSLGKNHSGTIGSLSNLATSYRMLQQFEKAYELALKVYQWRNEKFGANHPATLRAMNNLANSYEKTGKVEEANKLRNYLISLTHKIHGPEHPLTLAVEHNQKHEDLIDIDEEDSEDIVEEITELLSFL